MVALGRPGVGMLARKDKEPRGGSKGVTKYKEVPGVVAGDGCCTYDKIWIMHTTTILGNIHPNTDQSFPITTSIIQLDYRIPLI